MHALWKNEPMLCKRISIGLTVNRKKKVIFYRQPNRQKFILILIVKTFQGISDLTISADLHGLLAPEESA